LPHLHVFLNSPAVHEVTKTELDIGVVTEPYVIIAHCIRAGFTVSHALRDWVLITISFDNLGPLTMTLDPTTIRYLGTDERSILHIILRAQKAHQDQKTKVPHGVTLSNKSIHEILSENIPSDALLLIPGKNSTWEDALAKTSQVAMYCPLSTEWANEELIIHKPEIYQDELQRDLAILKVVQALDTVDLVMQKD
jgi:hypothetical protein